MQRINGNRRFDRGGPPVQRTRVNHLIRITPIRLIGPDNEQIGVVETAEAMRRAVEAGLDLVEIVPDSRPPVCKIMDYGKYKYELSQKQRKTRAASKSSEMKQIRLGRSVKIDPHDVQIRIDQARRFLLAGHKVHIVQRFRGREIAHRELGLEHLKECTDKLADVCKVEQSPRWFGKEASIILAPDKVKIEAIKRKLEKEKAARAKAEGKTEAQIAEEEKARIEAEEARIAAAEAESDDDDVAEEAADRG
ncbi:MAG: translation initiation factor IF-3 [Phycisphaerae bacterium]|nr:translation initiation factor IF-3 [Phycisphaerae bacterium]